MKICRYYCLSFNLNKVNIYCIYIKNYPESSGAGLHLLESSQVKSPRMRARGEEKSARARIPNLFKPLHPLPPTPAASRSPSLCPLWGWAREPGSAGRGGGGWGMQTPAAARCAAKGSRAAVKTEARSRDHSQKHRPEETWGGLKRKKREGDSFLFCLLPVYIIFN